jgi:hypothetical protein
VDKDSNRISVTFTLASPGTPETKRASLVRQFSSSLIELDAPSTQEKIDWVARWAIAEIDNKLTPEVITIRSQVEATGDIQDAKSRGELVRQLKLVSITK